MSDHLETEDKYDVDDALVVPSLEGLVPGATVTTTDVTLRSTYHDTADARLLGAAVTLRRREGDDDQGWHLKVPAGGSRTEIRLPLEASSGDVPDRLLELTASLRDDQPLQTAAVIETRRTRHAVRDADGTLLVEVDDDRVHAGHADRVTIWREVEVELGAGDPRLLAEVGRRLRDAGARPSAESSKLGRVLASPRSEPPGEAAATLAGYLDEQVRALVAGDVALRRGQDPVHDTRVAARRIRSVLRVFGDLFDPDRAAQLDADLRWWAGLLGEERDAQVQLARQRAAVAALPPELVMGPVLARLEEDLRGTEARARQAVLEAMAGARYRSLVADLVAWRTDPPFAPDATGGVGTLRRGARGAARKADHRLDRGLAADDDVLLHRARKAAKRARYAQEVVLAAGRDAQAKRRLKRAKRAQQVLGDHQDAVVAAALLARLGATAGRSGDNGFAFGVLWEREMELARRLRDEAADLRD